MADLTAEPPPQDNPPSAGFFSSKPRAHVALTLASHIGQVLTPELAKAIARELFPTIPSRSFEPVQYAGYVFALEPFNLVLPELHNLHREHFEETEGYRAAPINPDYEAMAESERSGQMLQFTARKDGALVGHMRIYLARCRHTQTLTASEDGIYVVPAHRGGFLVVHFWQYVERCLAACGAREFFFLGKASNRSDRLATYLKYKPVGTLFSKCLDQPIKE